MKKVISTLLVVCALTVFTGCKRNYTVYERHDITACGVKDPLVNLPWLAEECEKAKKAKNGETTISLLQDTVTKYNAFEIMYHYKSKDKRNIYIIDGYDCSGNVLFSAGLGFLPPNPETKEAFYKNKKHLGIIFTTKYK